MKRHSIMATTLILATGLLLSLPAEAGRRFTVRGYGAWISTSAETTQTDVEVTQTPAGELFEWSTLDVGGGSGWGLAVEFRVTPHLVGIELGVADAPFASTVDRTSVLVIPPDPNDPLSRPQTATDVATTRFDTGFQTVYLGVNFHLLKPTVRPDIYVGAFYAGARLGDGTVISSDGSEVRYETEDNNGWGLNVGLDVDLGERRRWFVGGGLRYLSLGTTYSFVVDGDPTAIEPLGVDINPLIFSIGGGYRF